MRTLLAIVAVCLVTPAVLAEIKVEPVEYKHGDTVLQGYIAYDDAVARKRPGVMVVHEWWGCNEYAQSRARQLAEMGYVAFACDMYGKGITTSDPGEAGKLAGKFYNDPKLWRERAAAGLKVLSEHKLVDATKLGAIGYCFGGTTCLQMACDGQPLKAVVSFHGSLFTPTAAEAKAVKGTVLICNGAADTFISEEDRKGLLSAFDAAKVDYIFVDYAGAVHSFTNPNAGKAGIDGVAYQAEADKRSWAHMRQVFEEGLGPIVRVNPQLPEPPAALGDVEIAKMDRPAAMKAWVERKTYLTKYPMLDAVTKTRLETEVAKLREQIDKAGPGGR